MEDGGSKTGKVILASAMAVGRGLEVIHLVKDCHREQAGYFAEFDLERDSPEVPPVRTIKLMLSSTGTAAYSAGPPILWPRAFTQKSS